MTKRRKTLFSIGLLLSVSVVFVFFNFVVIAQEAAPLSCRVTTDSPTSGEVEIFRMQNSSNAHAEMPGLGNYSYRVLCSGSETISNTCTYNYAVVLRLHSTTNSHAEIGDYSNYSNRACISSEDRAVSCAYASNCSDLGSGYTAVASISGATNAHVASPGGFSTQVCCGFGRLQMEDTEINVNFGDSSVRIHINRQGKIEVIRD